MCCIFLQLACKNIVRRSWWSTLWAAVSPLINTATTVTASVSLALLSEADMAGGGAAERQPALWTTSLLLHLTSLETLLWLRRMSDPDRSTRRPGQRPMRPVRWCEEVRVFPCKTTAQIQLKRDSLRQAWKTEPRSQPVRGRVGQVIWELHVNNNKCYITVGCVNKLLYLNNFTIST